MSEVRWKMDILHIISAIWSSAYQKLLQFMEIWQSSDKNNFAQFFLRHRLQLYNVHVDEDGDDSRFIVAEIISNDKPHLSLSQRW